MSLALWQKSPDRTEVVLLELTPALHLTAWTLVGGAQPNTYSTPMTRFILTATFAGGVYRHVVGVTQDATALTERFTLVDVEANPGSFWWDAAGDLLYVRTTTATPTSFTMAALVTFYVASQSIVLNRTDNLPETGIYYHPWLTSDQPTISLQREHLFTGAKIALRGDLELTNAHGVWDTLVAPDSAYHWPNKRARLWIGGTSHDATLLRSQYLPIATMLIDSVDVSETTCRFGVRPLTRLGEKVLPVTPYFESAFPHLGDGVRGTKKPLIYGRAIVAPDLTDTSGSGVYTVADAAFQTLFAVHTVTAVAKATGARTNLILTTDYTVNLTACTITIVNAVYTHLNYTLVAEVTGKPDGAGSYLKTAGAIIKDILQTHLGVLTSEIDTAAFNQADLDNSAELSMYLKTERTVNSILATDESGFPSLQRSVMGHVQQTSDGKWTFSIFRPWSDSSAISMSKADFAAFEPSVDARQRVTTTRVSYARNDARDESSFTETTDVTARYLDGTHDTETLHTYLRFQGDAAALRDQFVFLMTEPAVRIAFRERGTKLAGSLPGQKVLVTFSPAPAAAGSYTDTICDLTAVYRAAGSPQQVGGTLERVRQLAGRQGTWMATSAPDWATSTAAERLVSGYWCDANGRADPLDPASANVSLWW